MSVFTIFVKDFEILMSIGVYPEERSAKQRVLLNIEAQCQSGDIQSDDVSETVSYEDFVKTAQALAQERHYNLLELYAESLAEALLADTRIQFIKIRAEKPDIFKGNPRSVGVEIIRP